MISDKIVNLISINDENLQIFNAGLEPQNEFAGRLENCHCQVSVAIIHALFIILISTSNYIMASAWGVVTPYL